MTTQESVGMRRPPGRAVGLLLALLLLGAGTAAAETDVGPVKLSGDVGFGGRLVWGNDDNAKFQEYRDIQDGLIGDFDLTLEDDDVTHWFRARGENVGYKDQRYWLEGGRYGRYEFDLFYGELPWFQSRVSETPYITLGDSNFQLPISTLERDAIEAAETIAPGDLPFRRKKIYQRLREGGFGIKYHVGESVLVHSSYRIQDKQGNRAFGMNFGTPGGTFINLPAPVDQQTHEVDAGVDWQVGKSSFSIDYLGSFFQNNIKHVVGANPLVSPTTATTDPDQGRSQDWPDNWAQSLSLAGSTSLPIGMPNRVSANFAYGFRYQNDDFLPFTINPRIVDPELPQSSLDGKVQTLLGNVNGTFQLTDELHAKLRYRIYDFNNLTDPILFPEWVLNDTTTEDALKRSVQTDYTKQNANADLGWDFAKDWTGVLGFSWENWARSQNREVRHLNDFGPSLKLDYRMPGGTLLHAGYQFLVRDGSSYRPFAPIDAGTDLTDPVDRSASKFYATRKFDEANRYLNRFDVLARCSPTEPLELTFTGGVNYADYHDTDFGLQGSLGWNVGGDAYYQINDRVSLTGYYTYEWQKYWQKSRYRPRTFAPPIVITDDPANNWHSRTQYGYHNAGATLRVAVVPNKLDADLEYLINFGQEKTRAQGKPGGSASGDAVNYPRIWDTLQAIGTTLSWHYDERITLSASYRFEFYDITNFRFDNIPVDWTDGDNVYLRSVYGDYNAHVLAMRASIHF